MRVLVCTVCQRGKNKENKRIFGAFSVRGFRLNPPRLVISGGIICSDCIETTWTKVAELGFSETFDLKEPVSMKAGER